MTTRRGAFRFIITLTLLPASQLVGVPRAAALDLGYEASLAVGRSDNIRRTPTNEQEEDIAAAGLQFSLDHLSPRVRARAVGDVAYHEYLDDTFDSDFIGNVAADASFAIAPERLEWMIADSFGQVLSDPFSPASPDNREDINYFTTGPTAMFALGSQNRLRLTGRYSLVGYEESQFDSEATSGEIGFIRRLSAASEVSLNARAQQVEFDDSALDTDYDETSAFVRYEVTGARTHLGLDVGYTELERDAAAGSEDGLLLRLDATRRLSASTTASISAGREFSNSGSVFAASQQSSGISLGAAPGRQTAQPFTHEYVTLAWDFNRNRTAFGFYGSMSEETYDDLSSTLNQKLTSAGAHFTRQLSPQTQLALQGGYGTTDFTEQGDYDQWDAALSLRWRFSRSLSLTVTYDYYTYDSDRFTTEVEENRIWISLGYGRGAPRRELAPAEFAIDARE